MSKRTYRYCGSVGRTFGKRTKYVCIIADPKTTKMCPEDKGCLYSFLVAVTESLFSIGKKPCFLMIMR